MTTALANAAAQASPSKVSFSWSDPLLLEASLSEDERMIMESARSYCSERLMPRILEANRTETFDRAIMKELGELGFLGPMLPEEYGCEAQRRKFLSRLATGEFVGCFGLTEPDVGSDPAGMKTLAKAVSGGYSLSGSKMWITNSPIADIFIVWAKTEDSIIRGFILERGMKGLSSP